METKYYIVKEDLTTKFKDMSPWQLKKNAIIKDVGTNIFVSSLYKIVSCRDKGFCQLDSFETDLIKALIKKSCCEIEELMESD